jgi:hypothetical protein
MREMEAKHTPGPWTCEKMFIPDTQTDRRCGFVVNGPDDGGDGFPVRVCDLRTPPGISGYAEGQANARLIAAAPDLLEACRQIASDLEMVECASPEDAEIELRRLVSEHYQPLRAAIAKATGKGE